MLVDKSNKKSIRSAFGKALSEIGEINSKVVVMDADLACSTQTQMFAKKFPERFFDSGIAEQDMMATAAGLAAGGKIPFVASFAMFATGRTYDQIRNSICYPEFNVKIVGTHGGITVGEDGASHQALEDVALMRNIPHMTVIVPADSKECEEVVKYAAMHDGPMYIRIARSNVPDILIPPSIVNNSSLVNSLITYLLIAFYRTSYSVNKPRNKCTSSDNSYNSPKGNTTTTNFL